MTRFLQSVWFRLVTLYSRFQTLVLSIFVIGMIDLVVYSDAIMAFIAIPELMPVVIIGLLIFGVCKYIFRRKHHPKE
jgi:predicted tellurium resistance membrane protein TerC